MSIKMKIKHMSLGNEIKIIRREARKQLGYARYCRRTNEHDFNVPMGVRQDLLEHVRRRLKPEARATGLVRAFLKGTPYKVVEQPTRNYLRASNIDDMARMVWIYSTEFKTQKEVFDAIENWIDA